MHCHGDATRFLVSWATATRRGVGRGVPPSYALTLTMWLVVFVFRFLSVISLIVFAAAAARCFAVGFPKVRC